MAPSGHTKKALLGDFYVRYTIDKKRGKHTQCHAKFKTN